ncbi:DUF742 domain-containing protein [Saccharomonospora saliphila]|uniref:DUF742 domain-containing protein n=1 Tax=Saccharomonospora saliphila TaxID=369829 RepID=UPI0003A9ECDD|nr:DUF742 domain-containing protein [Saccharomonospora saliphila]
MIGRGDDSPDTDNERVELWVRPYTATNGRTTPSTALDLMSQVKATGRGAISEQWLGIEHSEALRLCRKPTSVAEVSAQLRQPVIAAKVLLSDLIQSGALIVRAPTADHEYANSPEVLEALIAGLKRL